MAQKLNPDVVLMAVTMPGLAAVEATRQIHAAQPRARVLMVSKHVAGQQCFCLGADGCILRDAKPADLLSAIQTVAAGGTYLSPLLSEVALHGEATTLDKLSSREREVLRLIAEGHSSAAIGRELHISSRTVDSHRHNIMRKVRIHSVAGLTRFAVRHGLSAL